MDYDTVAAFNPHQPPEPDEVKVPTPPEKQRRWDKRTDEQKAKLREQYGAALATRKAYEQAMQAWRDSAAVREASTKLGETLQDLERRGLVQYDGATRRYDLHPVVRGVAAGSIEDKDKERYGQRVVDHFNAQPHPPYEEAKTMEDVASGLNVVRTLLKLSYYKQAYDAYEGALSRALFFNLEAHREMLALLRPFFPAGWHQLPKELETLDASYLANSVAMALYSCGECGKALEAYGAAMRGYFETANWSNARVCLSNISATLPAMNQLAKALRVDALALDLATATEDAEAIFTSRIPLFAAMSVLGDWDVASGMWQQIDAMGRKWSRSVYRQGNAEEIFAQFQFRRGCMQEEHLITAATLAELDGNRQTLRNLHRLRGQWRLEQGAWALAAESFGTAVTMAREVRLVDAASETGLSLAKHHLAQLTGDDACSEAERLSKLTPSERLVAQLWLALGDPEKAKHHALAAYRWAWADGEPYVHRYELTQTTELLNTLGVPIPNLPPYDPTKDEPFPWEADVRAAIEKLKAEKKVASALAESSEP